MNHQQFGNRLIEKSQFSGSSFLNVWLFFTPKRQYTEYLLDCGLKKTYEDVIVVDIFHLFRTFLKTKQLIDESRKHVTDWSPGQNIKSILF